MQEPLIIKKFYRFKARHAQITTLFIVMLGVLLFLMTVLIDLNQVVMNKTSMAMGVDSAAATLGSMLTSQAKSLSDQAAQGALHNKKSGGFFSGWLGEFVGYVVIVVLVVITILSWGTLSPYTMAAIGAVIGAMAWGISEIYRRQAVMESYSDYLQMLNSTKDTYRESTLLSVIAGIVNDPVKVADIHDINRNGNTTEWVGRFYNHYEERLRLLVVGQGDIEDLETMVSDILNTSGTLFSGSDNLLDLRDFVKGDLWELFSDIDTPDYNASGLSLAIAAAEAKDYSVQERVTELANDPGYEVDSAWVGGHPHAEDNDDLPLGSSWNDETLCQLSLAIYAIYYSGEGGFDSFKACVDEFVSLSASEIVYLINSGSGEIFLSEIDDLCDNLEDLEEEINKWINLLGLKQVEIDSDVEVLEVEIDTVKAKILELEESDSLKKDALEALLSTLKSVRDYLEELEADIQPAKKSLDDYKSKISIRRLDLKSQASAIRNYETPIAGKVGKAVYAWKDTRGWHVVKAYVGSELIVPSIRIHKDKDWNKTTVETFIEPYYSSGEQKTLIQARRFDEPASTPWWNFYPSGRYSQEQWESLTADFEEKFANESGFVVEGESLYSKVDDFMESYGLKAQAKSSTNYANKVGGGSRWSIGIKDPQ